jgi:hypothetical protein
MPALMDHLCYSIYHATLYSLSLTAYLLNTYPVVILFTNLLSSCLYLQYHWSLLWVMRGVTQYQVLQSYSLAFRHMIRK